METWCLTGVRSFTVETVIGIVLCASDVNDFMKEGRSVNGRDGDCANLRVLAHAVIFGTRPSSRVH